MKAIGIFLSFFVFISSLLSAKSVTLRADVWCPYNCDPRSSSPGFMVEAAEFAFKQAGDTIDYNLMDWTRAVEDTKAGKYDGLVGTTRIITPNFIFPNQELALATQSFWTKRAFDWKYEDISSLDDVLLVIMDGYSYGEPLDSYITKYKNDRKRIKVMNGNFGRTEAANFVLSANNAVFIEETLVMTDFLVRARLLEYFNQTDAKLPPSKMYVAFTPAIPQAAAYAKILDDGITKLKQSGQWEKLLEKYGIKPW